MRPTLRSRFGKQIVKIVNIAAIVSLFSTTIPVLQVFAATLPLESLSATLAQPMYSDDWNTGPTYTNVTYTWALSRTLVAGPADPCLTTDDCFKILLDLSDHAPTTTYQGQEWMSTVTTSDFIWNGPSDVFVSSTLRFDNDGNGRYEQLEVLLGCSTPCAMVTSTSYSFDILNYPLKNPESTGVPGAYTTSSHTFEIFDQSAGSLNEPEIQTAIVVIGDGVSVTASVDPVLTFSIEGVLDATSFYFDSSDIDTVPYVEGCPFGTLTPGDAKVCLFKLNIETNAANGYAIYVVQDQNMTFNGNTIKQYQSGTRTDDSAANTWQTPSSASYGHLGYSSNDTSVFPPASGSARWAGIPDIATAGQAPVITGLVADSVSPGDDQYTYALKVESASTLPQAPASAGHAYSHNEYFIVVGNF